MVRIVGILCGSAVAISFLIIALGVPEFSPEPVPDVADVVDEIVPPPLPSLPIEPAVDPVNEAQVEAVIETTVTPLVEPQTAPQAVTETWYAFWSPFRSELAANGFVSQLQRTTGMDYRVVQLKPGVYEVAFLYNSDGDIASKLAKISAATGLEMPDG